MNKIIIGFLVGALALPTFVGLCYGTIQLGELLATLVGDKETAGLILVSFLLGCVGACGALANSNNESVEKEEGQ
jgi:hypothetical protein